MSSKSGPRAQGTDGTDFLHRQRVAAHYQESANQKFYLKFFYAAQLLVLAAMWAKVGSEVLRREFGVKIAAINKLDLPSAYPWEYVYSFNFIAIIFGLLSFPRNKLTFIKYHYYSQFLFGLLPVFIGMGSQLPELVDYFSNGENSKTPTFNGAFPMVFLWYVFFLLAMQIHAGAMYCSHQLASAWTPVKKTE